MARRRQERLDFRGDLQAEVMASVWELGEATVEDVRARQPAARRSAYTTIQTVMNRLVERGLLGRRRAGKAFLYKARLDEHEYIARSIGQRLAGASADTRRAALVSLVEGLEPAELDEIARLATRVKRERKAR
jgi:predicted transcriptional regulator